MKLTRPKLQSKLMSFGLIIKERDAQAIKLAKELISSIEDAGLKHKIFVERTHLKALRGTQKMLGVRSIDQMLPKVSCLIAIGGDGTLLRAARHLLAGNYWKKCSVLGLNAGHLGFLSVLQASRLTQQLARLMKSPRTVGFEWRTCIEVDLNRVGKKSSRFYALNDCVLTKGAISRLFEFKVEVDSEFLSAYRADGLIVSSPTGSTAYNLAAGGAIVDPSVSALQLTPICPQSLSAKPIVVSDKRELRLSLGRHSSDVYLTIDGHTGLKVQRQDEIKIRKSAKAVAFIVPPGVSSMHYFQSLRQKLKWGSSLSSPAST